MIRKIANEFKTPINSIIGLVNEINNINSSIDTKEDFHHTKNSNDSNYNNENCINTTSNYNSIRKSEGGNSFYKLLKNNLNLILSLSNYTNCLIIDVIQVTSQINIKDIRINIESLDPKEILYFCFNILTSLIECSENKFYSINPVLEFAEELNYIKLKSDEVRLKQILINFISNAVKFTKFGEIKLQAKLNEKQNFCEIFVSDKGIGIDKEHLNKIFSNSGSSSVVNLEDLNLTSNNNNFNNGNNNNCDNENKLEYASGLTLCKTLSLRLNHIISVDSVVGKGSCFRIIVPCVKTSFFKSQAQNMRQNGYFLDKSISNDNSTNFIKKQLSSSPLDFKINLRNSFPNIKVGKIDKINSIPNYTNIRHPNNKGFYILKESQNNFDKSFKRKNHTKNSNNNNNNFYYINNSNNNISETENFNNVYSYTNKLTKNYSSSQSSRFNNSINSSKYSKNGTIKKSLNNSVTNLNRNTYNELSPKNGNNQSSRKSTPRLYMINSDRNNKNNVSSKFFVHNNLNDSKFTDRTEEKSFNCCEFYKNSKNFFDDFIDPESNSLRVNVINNTININFQHATDNSNYAKTVRKSTEDMEILKNFVEIESNKLINNNNNLNIDNALKKKNHLEGISASTACLM